MGGAKYAELFSKKKQLFAAEFEGIPDIEYYESAPLGFRYRTEFSIKGSTEGKQFAMTLLGKKEIIKSFPIVSEEIQKLMIPLLDFINESKSLSEKLFQVEFQTARNKDSVVSLIYHKRLDGFWEKEASNLHRRLDVSIVGRSKKQKIVIGKTYVEETYKLSDSEYSLRLYEQCFSQTNPEICEEMLRWIERNQKLRDDDVVELHCGLGTFTILLSKKFRKVLATENSRPSFAGLKENLKLNKISNVFTTRLSGHETLQAVVEQRRFNRLVGINIGDFRFNTIFLDPPRDGLDKNTLNFLHKFDRIIYLSCGFESFKRDLQIIRKTHVVKKLAMFDQFPYTEHIESGAILQKK